MEEPSSCRGPPTRQSNPRSDTTRANPRAIQDTFRASLRSTRTRKTSPSTRPLCANASASTPFSGPRRLFACLNRSVHCRMAVLSLHHHVQAARSLTKHSAPNARCGCLIPTLGICQTAARLGGPARVLSAALALDFDGAWCAPYAGHIRVLIEHRPVHI